MIATMDMSYTTALRGVIEMLREAKDATTLQLPAPNEEVERLLTDLGARRLREWYETTCHSDTCNHHSHDPGQAWQEWEVPEAWARCAPEGDVSDLFDVDHETDHVVALLPGDVVLYTRSTGRQWASTTGVARLRAHAAEAMARAMGAQGRRQMVRRGR